MSSYLLKCRRISIRTAFHLPRIVHDLFSFSANQPFYYLSRALSFIAIVQEGSNRKDVISSSDLIKPGVLGGGNRNWGFSECRSRFDRRWGLTGRAGGHRGIMQSLRALDSKEEYFNYEHLEFGVIQAGKSRK